MSAVDMYNVFRFMKRYGDYSSIELEQMYPFEMEIFYYMLLRELKEKSQ